jgi:tetratricopeptide (TPR) repeat protein
MTRVSASSLSGQVLLVAFAVTAGLLISPASADSSAVPSTQSSDPRALWDQAERLRSGPKIGEALAIFQRIADEYGSTTFGQPAQFRVGECLASLRRTDEAIAAYRRVRNFSHSDWYGADWEGGSRYRIGQLLEQQDKVAEAIVAYRLAADPKNQWRGDALRDLAALYLHQRRYQEALQAYTDLAHTSTWWLPQGLWGIARTYEAAGRTEDFIRQCEKLHRLFPKSKVNAESLLRLAAMYETRGETDQALAAYERVAVHFAGMREGASALLRAGQMMEAVHRPERAAQLYIRLLHMYYPDSPAARSAADRLHARSLDVPRYVRGERRVLIDETHGEARTENVLPNGDGLWAGQREVLDALIRSGYVVHVFRRDCVQPATQRPTPATQRLPHEGGQSSPLTQVDLAQYAAVIINGGAEAASFTGGEIERLRDYVNHGGALLVVNGPWPGPIRDLASEFGIEFASGKDGYDSVTRVGVAPEDQAAQPFLPPEICVAPATAVTGKLDVVLVHCGGVPIVGAVKLGRGIVVAAGVGSGFMGNGLNSSYCRKGQTNEKLLVDLISWMMRQTKQAPG